MANNTVQTFCYGVSFNISFNNQDYKDLGKSVLRFNVPSISIGEIEQQSSIKPIIWPGTSISITDIDFDFMLETNFNNYINVISWMNKLKNFDEIKSEELFSDITINILDNKYNDQGVNISFENCFPKFISDISFDTQEDNNPLMFTSTFAVNNYTIESAFI